MSWLKTPEMYLVGILVRAMSMRVPLFAAFRLYLVGSVMICVRLRASSLKSKLDEVLNMSQFKSPRSKNSEDVQYVLCSWVA